MPNSGSLCRVTLTRGFWFADLESGDGFGGRAAGLGQQLVAVVDAEGMVGGLDGQGSSSVNDSDVNPSPRNGYGAAPGCGDLPAFIRLSAELGNGSSERGPVPPSHP